MSQIMKTFTGIFMVLLLGMVSGSMLSVLLTAISAQNLEQSIRYRLSASCFSPVVMEECFADAKEMDCGLKIALYEEQGVETVVADGAEIPMDTTRIRMAKIYLTFTMEAALPRLKKDYVLTGYVR